MVMLCSVLAGSLTVTAGEMLPTASALAAPTTSPCQFQKAALPLNVAFCDTFDHPEG